MLIRLSKQQLDQLSTLCGITAGVCTVLTDNQIIPTKWGATIGGIAMVFWGYLTNKAAGRSPTTEQVEEANLRK